MNCSVQKISDMNIMAGYHDSNVSLVTAVFAIDFSLFYFSVSDENNVA